MTDQKDDLELTFHQALAEYGGMIQSMNVVNHDHDTEAYHFANQFMVGHDTKMILTLSFRDTEGMDEMFAEFANWITEKQKLKAALEQKPDLKEAYERFLILRKLYGL